MNINQINRPASSSAQLFDELIKICHNISGNLKVPTQWIFINFLSKNWKIKDFTNELIKNRIYKPLQTQRSKIYVGSHSIKCNLCKRNKKLMIRNLCQHNYCWRCLENYILTHYSSKQNKKTILPLCLFYEQCSQIISHEIVCQILSKNENLKKEFKILIAEGFIRNQRQLKE